MSSTPQPPATDATSALTPSIDSARETVSLRQGIDGGIASETSLRHATPDVHNAIDSQIGKFVVERLLGHGGQAQAWLAHDPDLRRQIVLKLYHSARTPEEQEIVLREGRALAQVRHPAVAQCLGADRHNGVPYLIVEYVAGKTLSQSLREHPPTPEKAVELSTQIAAGVAAIHNAGLLHRDLKPANILVNDAGQPVIIDFGLAAAVGTHEGDSISGTPAYMAPEQARGESNQIGPATDVFGLGAILFEMLTGRPPYQSDATHGTWQKAIEGGVDPVEALAPHVAPKLAAICNRCLATNPRFRYPSTNGLQVALNQWLTSHSQGHHFAWLWTLGRFRLRLSFGVSLAAIFLAIIGWKLGQPALAPVASRDIAQSVPAPQTMAKAAHQNAPSDTNHVLPREKRTDARVAAFDSPQPADMKTQLLRHDSRSAVQLQFNLDLTTEFRQSGAPPDLLAEQPIAARVSAVVDCQLFIWQETPGIEVTQLIPDANEPKFFLTAAATRTLTLQISAAAPSRDPAHHDDLIPSRLHILATYEETPALPAFDHATHRPFNSANSASPAAPQPIAPSWHGADEVARWRRTLQQFLDATPKSKYAYEVLPVRVVPAKP